MSSTRLKDPKRLAALQRSGLIGRPLNEQLHRIVCTAASTLRADVAQLNVLDSARQHHLVFWPPAVATIAEPVPLSESGCAQVVELGTTLVVPDALQHPVLCMAKWAPVMRAYLGTPINYEGEPIGSLCVLAAQPRQWDRTEVLTLEAVGRLVSHALV